MATFELQGDALALSFTPLERLGGLRRGARVPLTDVSSVEVVQNPWKVAEGLRVGTGIPWVVLLGTMLRRGANDVVALYGQKPAVVVTLREGAPWRRLMATVPDAGVVADTIRAALPEVAEAK